MESLFQTPRLRGLISVSVLKLALSCSAMSRKIIEIINIFTQSNGPDITHDVRRAVNSRELRQLALLRFQRGFCRNYATCVSFHAGYAGNPPNGIPVLFALL